MKSTEQILHLLKREGRLTANQLAKHLGITPMGARQHLSSLTQRGLIDSEDVKVKVGRPHKYWFLTAQGHEHFIDRHSDLTLDMLDAVIETFGQSGLDSLTQTRQAKLIQHYKKHLSSAHSWQQALQLFVKMRDDEGYMTELETDGDNFLFIENHCPIRKAATHCPNLCQSELQILTQLFGDQCEIQRQEHMLKLDRRCAYLLKPKSAEY